MTQTQYPHPTLEYAKTIGLLRGGRHTKNLLVLEPQTREEERALFEAWYAGRSGSLQAVWNGKSYVTPESEKANPMGPAYAAFVQEAWNVWHDRALLERPDKAISQAL